MDIVLKNPFRVLGLPATANTRDITKRISDLETFAELGKIKSYPHDFPVLGALDRSLEAIKDTARKIEHIEDRLFHSFFWFRAGNSVDELAFECLGAGNINEAADIWSKQLGKNGVKKYTWRLNRGVVNLLTALRNTLDISRMNDAMEDFGFVINNNLDDSIQDVLAGNESGLNRDNLWRRIVDEMVALVQSYEENPYGNNAIGFVKSFGAFPTETQDYVSAKIVNPLIEKVTDAIKVSEEIRANDDLDALKVKNHLDKVEYIIKDLQRALGDDNIRFQTIANAYADEACICAIAAGNHFSDPKISMSLIRWASGLPSFSQVKTRIEENLTKIQEWGKNYEKDAIYEELLKKIKVSISSLTQASSLLNDMLQELAKIKTKIGVQDELYVQASSACAYHILEYIISTMNSAIETFSNTKNLKDFEPIVIIAASLTRKLLNFELDEDAKTRVNENLEAVNKYLETIQGLKKQLPSTTMPQPYNTSTSDSENIFALIPSWVWWVVVIAFILWRCSTN
jgi:hypothetical protein